MNFFKKIIGVDYANLRVLIILWLLCFVIETQAHSGTMENGVNYEVLNNGISITGYSGTSGDVVIPAAINVSGTDIPVSTIKEYAFRNCSVLKKITIPETVISIGENAFDSCNNLKSATFLGDAPIIQYDQSGFNYSGLEWGKDLYSFNNATRFFSAPWNNGIVINMGGITRHPQSQCVRPGAQAYFQCWAEMNREIKRVQWQVSPTGVKGKFSDIDIETNPSAAWWDLIMSNVTKAQNGYAYRAVITNDLGSCTTAPATLWVTDTPITSLDVTFNSDSDIGLTMDQDVFISGPLNIQLNYAPSPGTNLTVIQNNSTSFINGTFNCIQQGDVVPLTYNGVTCNYIVNYYGGNGRSLILQWPCTGLYAWGSNNTFGQMGNGSNVVSAAPTPVHTSGVLKDKTIVAVASGWYHTIVLTSNGEIFTWGGNSQGQLGNNSTVDSWVPTPVVLYRPLRNKRVVAIAAGAFHSMALTSDGQVFTWGSNGWGQLGNNSTMGSLVPVAVDMSRALAGKTVVAIAAGGMQSMALTADGQVYYWGENMGVRPVYDPMSESTLQKILTPISIVPSYELGGKTVTKIAAGFYQCLVLTSNGQIFVWGSDMSKGSMTEIPLSVSMNGTLADAPVVGIAGGIYTNLGFTLDNQVFSFSGSAAKIDTSILENKTISSMVQGWNQMAISTTDGQLYGRGNLNLSSTLVSMSSSGELAGKKITAISEMYFNGVAIFGSGSPAVITQPINQTVVSGSDATFIAEATNNPACSIQWQVSFSGNDYDFYDVWMCFNEDGTSTSGTLTLPGVSIDQSNCIFRAAFTNNAGTTYSNPVTLKVLRNFAWYKDQCGLAESVSPEEDSNHIGINNLTGYAFGINPVLPDRSQLPRVIHSNGNLQITYPRWKDAADLAYTVEVSDDLQTWRSGSDCTEQISVMPIDGVREQVIEQLIPTANTPRRFMRLKLISNP